MALSIRNRETESLAREVAALAGESLTETIHKALAERLERLRTSRERADVRREREIDEILDAFAKAPVRDSRSPEEVLGYDERGLPR